MNLSKQRLADAVIRNYRPEDRAALRTICYDTGLMGDPIDPYFGCMELFADYWMNYYTDHEPESAFVAEVDGQVIGYLAGCKDTSVQQKIQKKEVMPRIYWKLFTFGYKVDRRFFSFMRRYLRSMWRNEFLDEPIKDYPAHLHMNMADGCRSGGIGSRLLAAYLDYLRRNNVRGLHLGTTTHNKLAVPFYKKRGFRLLSRSPLTTYEGIIPEKIEVLLFTRELSGSSG
jgi:GNAT superfamily N-acetyltransferase